MQISPWPSFSEEEAKAVSDVLISNKVNYWTGTLCKDFELRYAEWIGVKHAIAVSNGSAALELALEAIKIEPGDEVIVTPRSFIASASSVVLAGGIPVFADVDRNSQNISAETIAALITPRTRAIICVHLGGMPCEMDEIMSLADNFELKVIEDCSQAHGAKYKGKSLGSIGHIGIWSFCQDKIITTGGEGGMVTTNDTLLFETMWSYKDHGKNREETNNTPLSNRFRFIHKNFGTNWRMMEMQAAIGLIQLNRITEWNQRRNKIAKKIEDECRKYYLFRTQDVPDYINHAYYRFYTFINPQYLATAWSRDRIIDEIRSRGIPCFQGACPEIYLEPAFENSGFKPAERLPIAQELGETSLAFLIHPTITDPELDEMLFNLKEIFMAASL
jgi:dTDP-4-amino-4,6-dideoxygalactose transaminase